MALNRLESIFNWLNKLNPNLKTVIIIVLALYLFHFKFSNLITDILIQHQGNVENAKSLAEEYTIKVASELNANVESILKLDPNATNVILLNYHNSVQSTNGLSYRYLTALTEKKRGFDTKSCLRIWKELEYINYEEELRKINRNGYLELDSLVLGHDNFPKITELLYLSGAKAAAIYPILGVDGPLGMIVIIYSNEITHEKNYYKTTIASYIQPIGHLLDYNAVKDKMN